MAYPEDLLEQARHLAQREPKRPKQASLRRAVSSAYYALFHLLASETAKNWKRPAERPTVERMLNHDPMGSVCRKKRDELKAWLNTNPAAGPELDRAKHLLTVTTTFAGMLHHRHTADYDNSAKWTRFEASDIIDAVTGAFASWKAIKHHHDAQNFLVTLLLRERKP